MVRALGIEKNQKNYDNQINLSLVLTMPAENADKKFEELRAKGVNFLNMPTKKQEWRIRVVHLVDPEENIIEFLLLSLRISDTTV